MKMIGIDKYCKNVALSLMLAGGLTGFATVVQAHGRSDTAVRKAQEQLRDDGYYKGSVDGVDGPATHAAIRRYQRDKNLAVTGRLDKQTRKDLGVKSRDKDDRRRADAADRHANEADRRAGEADRSVRDADRPVLSSSSIAPSSAAVSAAQRRLHQKGFYKGSFDARMGPETQAAIREYQKSSNLNVTGKLDPATLSSLGVSK